VTINSLIGKKLHASCKLLISLAIPTRNSHLFIDSLIAKINYLAVRRSENFEVIFLDDASSDNTINAILLSLNRTLPPNVSYYIFQNYVKMGQQKNSLIALSHASGDKIFLVEDDMNIESDTLEIFLHAEESNQLSDLLIGTQSKPGHSRLSSWLFWRVLNIISRGEIPRREMILRMFTRESLNFLMENGQANWTVTENCHRLFSRKTYIELDSVTYLKGTSRHSLLNRMFLAAEIFLRYVRIQAFGFMLMSFVASSSLVATLLILGEIIKDVDSWFALSLTSLIFCTSSSFVIYSLYQILIDSALPCKSLPRPKKISIPMI
jgi:glycosyltransferase involved in cell wall biosynthesis